MASEEVVEVELIVWVGVVVELIVWVGVVVLSCVVLPPEMNSQNMWHTYESTKLPIVVENVDCIIVFCTVVVFCAKMITKYIEND